MIKLLLSILVLALSLTASAECLDRFYSKDHLKKYPNQEIRNIIASVEKEYIFTDLDMTTNAKVKISIILVRNKTTKNVEVTAQCKKLPDGFLFDPYGVDFDSKKAELVCSDLQKTGNITLTKLINNKNFDLKIKLDKSVQLIDSKTQEKIKLMDGDETFQVKMDPILGDDACEPVLFLPEKVTTPRLWSEAILQSVRYDLARPTVTSRNLFHFSMLLWDVYSLFDSELKPYLLTQKPQLPGSIDIVSERNKALSYAAYSFIMERFKLAPGNVKDIRPNNQEAGVGDGKPDEVINSMLKKLMLRLGNDTSVTFKTQGFNSAELGTLSAQELLKKLKQDGSREEENYAPPKNYVVLNNYNYMDVMQSGVRTPVRYEEIKNANGDFIETKQIPGEEFADKYDIDHWLPMYVPGSLDQNGNELDSPQLPLTLFWGHLNTFSDLAQFKSPNKPGVYFDDIAQILTFQENPDEFIRQNVAVLEASQSLSPVDLVAHQKDFDGDGKFDENPGAKIIDISPKSKGNNPLGTNAGQGYSINPITKKPYQPMNVKRADYYRSLAEFWADGPRSETPPGHWNVIANTVIDEMIKNKMPLKWKGQGQEIPREQYELMLYMTLNGALYDAGIVAWGLKGHYQGSRPIGVLRKLSKMAEVDPAFGKKLEQLSPHLKMITYNHVVSEFDKNGELKETVTQKTKLAALAWRGPVHFGDIPNYRNTSFQQRNSRAEDEDRFYREQNDGAGVGWILVENWMPYQQQTFVTPPFPGFISGHSTFSRAAAEVLTGVTGSEFFPGGLGTYPAPKLVFEDSVMNFNFQWARYYDAADESGLSRIYGGIHASFDDIPGRKIGAQVGKAALQKADLFFKK